MLTEHGGSAAYSLDQAPERPAETVFHPVEARAIRAPSLLQCWLLITWIKLLLRILRFVGTAAWIQRRIEHIPARTTAGVEAVKLAEYAVAMAGAFYPGRAKCLEQSLALYYLLRRQGVAARYCQGVQPYPFQAHAWIEYRGEIINDVAEHATQFARLPDQLP